MCLDPWPVDSQLNEYMIKDFADKLSIRFGYSNYIDAYHKMNSIF